MSDMAFEISALPSVELDKRVFIDVIGRQSFALVYNLNNDKTYLYFENHERSQANGDMLSSFIPGLEFRESDAQFSFKNMKTYSLYRKNDVDSKLINQIIAFTAKSGFFSLFFIHCTNEETEQSKTTMEKLLSAKKVKLTTSSNLGFFGVRSNSSVHMDVYEESEEKSFLIELLEDLNGTILSGRTAYKIFLCIPKDLENSVVDQILERHIILQESDLQADDILEVFKKLRHRDSILYGTSHTSGFIELHGEAKINYPVNTVFFKSGGSICLGKYAKNGASITDDEIRMEKSALNLGFIISGLPGSGKTREAMSVISQVIHENQTDVAVISPTSEWNAFAMEHHMEVIRPNIDGVEINFFFSPEINNAEKFYEDLALLISAASDSGPYQNPMEKCLLNAFKSAYKESITPNPSFIYTKIVESVVKMHGRITNTGIKYTKHGENIIAALEELRTIIGKKEYSASKGINFKKLLETGVVFDLSGLSNNLKPYFYALILNQIYSIANGFGTDNDNSLKMLICIEEAQTIFGSTDKKENAASKDLEMRIQDFRKKGTCIMLMTHNVTSIKQEIRRLCQNKLYFKQAADVAQFAARDLTFTYAEQDDIVTKLKHLDSRIGALDFVAKSGNEKSAVDSVFVRTLETSEYRNDPFKTDQKIRKHNEKGYATAINIDDRRTNNTKNAASISIEYIGERFAAKHLDGAKCIIEGMLPGRMYTVQLFSEAGKQIGRCAITADKEVFLIFTDFELNQKSIGKTTL